MNDVKDIYFEIKNDLHLQSTISELSLFDVQIETSESLSQVAELFHSNNSLPGILINKQGTFYGFISRKKFFELLSQPYSLELYSKRSIFFFYESLDEGNLLKLPSSMPIVEAVQIALKRPKDLFDDPIIVEFENNKLEILDCYQLILAHSQINMLAMQALSAANELKTDLLSMAAHDLKNPLNTIINLSKIIKSLIPESDAEIFEFIVNIHDSADHMFRLILELLNSTVIESGRIQLKKQPVDLGELVSAIIYQCRTQAENKAQSIEYNIDVNDEFYTMADAVKIRESIENLISNAIKYSSSNSKINIKLVRTTNNILFSIKDSGPGLTDEDKKKLFGRFQRLSAQPTAGESSTGLGLFIAKQIVDLHDGKIWVESKYGYGATFFIELPVVDFY